MPRDVDRGAGPAATLPQPAQDAGLQGGPGGGEALVHLAALATLPWHELHELVLVEVGHVREAAEGDDTAALRHRGAVPDRSEASDEGK
eukprot:14958334-Heterocapsa_arctica.AAC.1